MRRKYKFSDNDKLYFISFAATGWIDLFIRREYKEILLESWKYCQREKDLEIYGWCIMTSHVYMIIGSHGRRLDKILSEMKSFASRSMRKAIYDHPGESRREWMIEIMRSKGLANGNNKFWQLWQQHNHPIELLNLDMFHQTLEYIHNKPVEAGFVDRCEDYTYSSARDFYSGKGLIDLCYVA